MKYSVFILYTTGVRGGGTAVSRLEKFQGKFCFQDKRKLLKIPE